MPVESVFRIVIDSRLTGSGLEELMAKRGEALTLSADVGDRLREEILSGAVVPGAPLRPAALRDRFGVSLSVVREALTRLAESHLVVTEPNQGFRVRKLSTVDLSHLMQVRLRVEPYALELAIGSAGLDWETRVIAEHHRLLRTPRHLGEVDVKTLNPAWIAAHEAFHTQLLAGCGNPVLLELCTRLFDSFELYRRWSTPAGKRANRDVEAEHSAIAQAAISRDGDAASSLLIKHITKTAELALDSERLDSHAKSDSG